MQEKIFLPNRYGDKNYLQNTEGSKYLLKLENPSMPLRVAYEDNNTIVAIDPSGGPYISLGDTHLTDGVLLSIEETSEGYELEFGEI